jgi:hypothetical protein
MRQQHSHREKSLGLTAADVPAKALPVVRLPQKEIERGFRLAKRRNSSYKAIDGGDVFGDLNSLDSHQRGILGELAVAKFYGIEIDSEVYDSGDGGRDFQFFNNSIDTDVKTTATKKMQLPELLVKADKGVNADLYIQAHIIKESRSEVYVRLLGYATADTVTARSPRRHPGRTKNYVVEPNELTMLPHFNTVPDR